MIAGSVLQNAASYLAEIIDVGKHPD